MDKQKRKQKTLTLAEKVRIVDDFEANGGTHEALGRKYGIGSSTVTRFLQHKDEMREKLARYSEQGVTNRRTMKAQSFPLLEEVLFIWVLQQRSFVASDVLRAKAELLFGELLKRGIYEDQRFAFSDGWMRRFRSRFGLQTRRVAGDVEAACLKFKSSFYEKLVSLKLKMCQVYSANESFLFMKMLPARNIVLSNEKTPADRCTFMPCANMDGSHKLKLMFIGTSDEPGCLGDLPVSYCCSENAWMTRQLFKSWFHQQFVPAVRKFSAECSIEPRALLLLDNCTAHYDSVAGLVSDDGLIGVMFLPPNVTSQCQPMNQVVINAIKMSYKRKLMQKLIMEEGHLSFEDRLKKITVQECIGWIAEAWDEISPKRIKISWKQLVDHFPQGEFRPPEICDAAEAEDDAEEARYVRQLVAAVDKLTGTSTTEQDLEVWLKNCVYDANNSPACLTSKILSDEDILDLVLQDDFAPVPVECHLVESMDDTSLS